MSRASTARTTGATGFVLLGLAACFVACIRPAVVPPESGLGRSSQIAFQRTPEGPRCERSVEVIDSLPPGATVLREVSATCEYSYPSDCEKQLRERACELGADALVLDAKEGSTEPAPGTLGPALRRVRTGRALRLGGGAGADADHAVLPPPAASPPTLARLCELPPSATEPPSWLATTVAGGRARIHEWHVATSGALSLFPSELDEGSAVTPGQAIDLRPASQLAASSAPARRPPPPPPSGVSSARYSRSGAPQRCVLTLPASRPRDVGLQWYNFTDSYHRFAVLWPASGSQAVIVLHQHLFSPGIGWFAPTVGDLDGDGRSDLAFVSRGVGTCGGESPPDCALWWIDIVMTATDTPDSPLRLVIARNEEAIASKLGLDVLDDRARWSGRIRPGAFDVTVSGPRGRHTWTAALRGGDLILGNALP